MIGNTPAALRATPSRGRCEWPGEAGSTASLGGGMSLRRVYTPAALRATPSRGRCEWSGQAGSTASLGGGMSLRSVYTSEALCATLLFPDFKP